MAFAYIVCLLYPYIESLQTLWVDNIFRKIFDVLLLSQLTDFGFYTTNFNTTKIFRFLISSEVSGEIFCDT